MKTVAFRIFLAVLVSMFWSFNALAKPPIKRSSNASKANHKTKVFHVSTVGKDKSELLSVFAKVQEMESGGDQAEGAPQFSKEQFIQKLKGGHTWTLPKFAELECKVCFGDGKLTGLRDNATCQECGGKGTYIQDWVIKW